MPDSKNSLFNKSGKKRRRRIDHGIAALEYKTNPAPQSRNSLAPDPTVS